MLVTTAGAFLYNLLCAMVSCDGKWETPEIRETPLDPQDVARNLRVRAVDPIVHLPHGALEGYIGKSNLGRDFFAFEGIKYGQAARWKPPVPSRPWRGVRSAKKPGPDCLQISPLKTLRVYGNEDCLFLNVYTPSLPNDFQESHPVIVFIHGGSFILGSGQENGPSYMMNENVVLVTLNYRLGVLGFFSTGDDEVPGNWGLHDQALALKWVHENIRNFGGDPQRVTLMGNSAGGASTELHMVSNKTRGYFRNAFCSSGSAFHFWAVQSRERMREMANLLGKHFGCQRRSSRALANCLGNIDASLLAAAQLHMFDWFPFPPVLFSPTIDGDFLTISPKEAYETGVVADKPIIHGNTKDEGKTAFILMLPMIKTLPMRVMWDQIAPYYFQIQKFNRTEELMKKINEFYFKGTSPRKADLNIYAEMMSDRYLTFGIVKGVQAHKLFTKSPTYFYYFSFTEGNHNMGNLIGRNSQEWGAGHAEDMFYFFNNSALVNGQKLSDPDRELGSIMIKLLVNYAATGVPSYKSENGEDHNIWDPVDDASRLRALQFDKKVEMTDFPARDIDRLNFWLGLNVPEVTLWSPLLPAQQSKIRLKLN